MQRKVLHLLATTASIVGVAVFGAVHVQTRPAVSQSQLAPATVANGAPVTLLAAPHEAPRLVRPSARRPAAIAAPATKAEAIADSDAFRVFGDRAGLDDGQRRTIARIIELYRGNSAALYQIAEDDKLENMQRRLLRDTAAQLHVRIPASSWNDFVQCGFVENIQTVVKGGAAEPG
jgi:hypothetical protein